MMRKKLLFVQPVVNPPGGGNAVAAWMLEALKAEYAITTLTFVPIDVSAVNRFYGTALRESDFGMTSASSLMRGLIHLDPDPESIQPANYLFHAGKKLAGDFDLVVSAFNEVEFGRPAIQYVHYPYLGPHYRRYAHSCGDTLGWRIRAVLRKEIARWMFLSGFSFDRMKSNLSLTNSDWTGGRIRDLYGTGAVTVYPPVPGTFPHVPWDDREDGFVCVGRFHPAKRLDWVIETLARVRRIVPRLRLHVVGTRGQSRDEVRWLRRILPLFEANSSWVHVHEDLSRDELLDLVSRQRYGIHAQVDEHFGIAPAEMVRAGCITFVHDSGGQVEIVGNDPRLTFDTMEQAVERIATVVDDARRQAELVEYLSTRRDLFTAERFVREIRQVVGRWCEEGGPAPSSSSRRTSEARGATAVASAGAVDARRGFSG